MPPRTPSAKPRSPGASPGGGDTLVELLESKQAELASTAERLLRLKSAKAAADGERWTLSSQLQEERRQFDDVNGYLKHALEEQTQRANGLEARLTEAQALARAARDAAASSADAAEQRHAAEAAAWRQQLEEQRDRWEQAEAFLADRDALQARADELAEQLAQHLQQQQRVHLELERKHTADRELWRRETQEAVRAARDEMAALTDQRLDASTQKAMLDNEAIASELQYQARHVQGLLSSNSALQQEVEELRLALGISRQTQGQLGQRARACEKAADSLLGRLAAVEAQRAQREQALCEAREELFECREEAAALKLKLDDQHSQIEEVGASLAAKQRELKQAREGLSDSAAFLLSCLGDVRQEQQALRGQAALVEASREAVDPPQRAAHLLARLTAQQRAAALQRLLRLLGSEWLEREGMVLPASSSTRSLPPAGEASPSQARSASCSPQASGLSLGGHSSSQWRARHSVPTASSVSTAGGSPAVHGQPGGSRRASPEAVQGVL